MLYIKYMEELTMKPKTLKKLVFFLAALLILACQSIAGNYVSKETENKIRETIKAQVKHPGYVKIQDNLCCADIIFTITQEGKLVVRRIITDNEALSSYLTEKLSTIQFSRIESPLDQDYRIKLSFRLI